ncbi:hypothetical protein ACFLX1_00840 [Chloroflexota bacterium]
MERLGELALDVTPQSRPRLLQMLAQSKVEALTNTTVSQITDDNVVTISA